MPRIISRSGRGIVPANAALASASTGEKGIRPDRVAVISDQSPIEHNFSH